MSTAIVEAPQSRAAGHRRSSAGDAFPPILTVNCVPVEKRSAPTKPAQAQARVDSWRRRSCVSMLPRLSRGTSSLCPICGVNGTFLQHVRHRRAAGEAIRVSLAICPPNHSRSIISDIIQQFRHVLIDIGDESPSGADLVWVSQPTANSLRSFSPHQRMNVFPFLNRMMTKANIAKQLNLHRSLFPNDFDFYPETLELPRDLRVLQRIMKQESETGTWILKPTKGLQGIGIVLARTFSQVEQCIQMNEDKVYSVQRYIDRPMLLHDAKWDMRIYVMLESLNPFRAHLFKDGLARFATEKYVPPRADNLGQSMVHLTNYSLNKKSYRFRMYKQGSVAEEECHKRTIGTTLRQLQEAGYPVDAERVWEDVGAIVAKTLAAMWPQLQDAHATYFKKVGSTAGASYDQSCFHILGFDIMMDVKGKLWLLEVNSNPSLNRDSIVDAVINEQLMESALKIVRALDPKQQPAEKPMQSAKTISDHLQNGDGASSNDESTDDDDNDNACCVHKSISGRRTIISAGERDLVDRSHHLARLPHIKPMTHMPLYIDLTYSHLMIFNRPITDAIVKADEGNGRMTSTQTTLWRIYASNLWEPKRSSRASARLLHALSRFQPLSMPFGAADAHIIYAQLQSYSTNRTYPWRQAFEFASDCPAMTFSMFCEAVAVISRRWYPRENPLESLNAFLSAHSETNNGA